jgi:hypothetical protein
LGHFISPSRDGWNSAFFNGNTYALRANW